MSRRNRKQLKCPSSALHPSLESIGGRQQDSVLGRVSDADSAGLRAGTCGFSSVRGEASGRGAGLRVPGRAPPSADVEGGPRSPSRPRAAALGSEGQQR